MFDFFDSVMDSLSSIFDLLDSVGPFMFLLVGLLFLGIAGVMIRENLQFARALPTEGTIVSVSGSGQRTYATIEYPTPGGVSQFTSSMATPGAKAGQRIDIEINDAGKARVRSPSHGQMAIVIVVVALPLAAAGVYLISKG